MAPPSYDAHPTELHTHYTIIKTNLYDIGSIKSGPYLRLAVDVDAVEAVVERVDDDENVSELGGDDATPVVTCVLRPDDLNLVVAKVTQLLVESQRCF